MSEFPNTKILWIEEQVEEYDPLSKYLKDLTGEDNVTIALTQEEGLARLQKSHFDLVLLDCMLPKDSKQQKNNLVHLDAGYEILEALRANSGWTTSSDCIVVVFSARGNSGILVQMEKLIGAKGKLIQKPLLPRKVINEIRNLLISNS